MISSNEKRYRNQLQKSSANRRRLLNFTGLSVLFLTTGRVAALSPSGPKVLDLEDKIQYSDYVLLARADEIQYLRLDPGLGRYVNSGVEEAEIAVATLSDVNLLLSRPGFRNIPWRVILPRPAKTDKNELIKEFVGRKLIYFIRETVARLPSDGKVNEVIWHNMDLQSQTALPEEANQIEKVNNTIATLKRKGRLFKRTSTGNHRTER